MLAGVTNACSLYGFDESGTSAWSPSGAYLRWPGLARCSVAAKAWRKRTSPGRPSVVSGGWCVPSLRVPNS